MSSKLPHIPRALIVELNKRFPEESPRAYTQSHDELMWQGGQRSVIRLLNREYQDQTKENLNVPFVP